LYLHIVAVESWLFDEVTTLKDLIGPRQLSYMMLSPFPSWRSQAVSGNLIFACPVDFLSIVTERWFGGFQVEIQGFVTTQADFGQLAYWYFQPDSPDTVRGLMRSLYCGFRVWPDKNGIDVFTDKLDATAFRALMADTQGLSDNK
jgi:hypothetical protein